MPIRGNRSGMTDSNVRRVSRRKNGKNTFIKKGRILPIFFGAAGKAKQKQKFQKLINNNRCAGRHVYHLKFKQNVWVNRKKNRNDQLV